MRDPGFSNPAGHRDANSVPGDIERATAGEIRRKRVALDWLRGIWANHVRVLSQMESAASRVFDTMRRALRLFAQEFRTRRFFPGAMQGAVVRKRKLMTYQLVPNAR